MPRTVDSSLVAELAKDSFTMVHLVELAIGSGINITDCAHDVTYSGTTYLASDQLLDIGGSRETQDLRVNTVTVELSTSDENSAYLAIFLANDWVNRSAVIKKACISNGSVVGAPLTIFNGQISKWQAAERSGRSAIRVAIASHWADFEKTNGRLTNNSSQQRIFPDDLGFEYAASTARDISWGRD